MKLFHISVEWLRRLPALSALLKHHVHCVAVVVAVIACLPAAQSAMFLSLQDESELPAVQDPPASGENQPPEPRTLKDESESLDPTNKDALAWYMAGHKALKRGDLKEAADAFEKSAAAAPESPIPLRARAMVLFRLGRAADGLATAETAMKMDQDDWQTRLELAVAFFSESSAWACGGVD